MDQGLFGKYIKTLTVRKNKQEEVISYVQQETGITLLEEEFTLQKNTISFHITSVKKMILQKHSITELLKKKGYNVTI